MNNAISLSLDPCETPAVQCCSSQSCSLGSMNPRQAGSLCTEHPMGSVSRTPRSSSGAVWGILWLVAVRGEPEEGMGLRRGKEGENNGK